jgi:hypothetical protein
MLRRPQELFWLAAIFGLLSFQFEWNQTSSNPVCGPRQFPSARSTVRNAFVERRVARRSSLGRRALIGLVSHCKWRDLGFLIQRGDPFVPFCGLFISMSEGENIDFREVRPTDLQTNGKSILRKTARN